MKYVKLSVSATYNKLWNFSVIVLGCLSFTTGREVSKQLDLQELNAECTKEGISVMLFFKKPFAGIAYSHGHYETEKCRYITQESEHGVEHRKQTGTNFSFVIPMNECGTVYHESHSSSTPTPLRRVDTMIRPQTNDNEVYIENTLLIQNDPTIQEDGDFAKTLRCVWQKEIYQPLVATLPIRKKQEDSTDPQQKIRIQSISGAPVSKYERVTLGDKSDNNGKSTNHFKMRFHRTGQVQPVPSQRGQHGRSLRHDDDEVELEVGVSEEVLGHVQLPLKQLKEGSQGVNPAISLPLRQAEFFTSGGTMQTASRKRGKEVELICFLIHTTMVLLYNA